MDKHKLKRYITHTLSRSIIVLGAFNIFAAIIVFALNIELLGTLLVGTGMGVFLIRYGMKLKQFEDPKESLVILIWICAIAIGASIFTGGGGFIMGLIVIVYLGIGLKKLKQYHKLEESDKIQNSN